MAYRGGAESSSSSSTFTSTLQWKYHVFLSFAGNDTRLKFVGHLDEAFKTSGIKTFKDDVDLERGGVINQDLFQAIEDSLCAVLIISENYAKSTWCLDELLKILECRNKSHRRVFPIFYDVDPSDVRHQRKRFREALAEHEEKGKENTTKVQNWRNALSEIANLSGYDARCKHEADLIKDIVGDAWTYLSSILPSHDDNLVGIESRVNDIMSMLEIGLDDKRVVGIWGMGGVGKTTLARVVFKKLSYKFEGCCFLANVRENSSQRDGLVSLQERLLSDLKIQNMKIKDIYEGMEKIKMFLCNKKVLLVLDDLDDVSQLNSLAESPNWFGEGSRIIITTRNNHLLTLAGVDQRIYEMKVMKKEHSLQLFLSKAFKKDDHRKENYLKLSEEVVKYAGCLPLALQVLGSFLCGRSEDEWRDALDRLRNNPEKEILQVLQISYDGLNKEEKIIFLDVACFFKYWSKKKVIRILKRCGLHPTIGMNVLIEKTILVEREDGTLDMHDLLEELGRYIVRQESSNNVGKQSRLWEFEDIKKVLENNTGSEEIQAIVLSIESSEIRSKIEVHPEAFSKMSNLRLLLLAIDDIWDDDTSESDAVQWPSFPFRDLPVLLAEHTLMDKLKYLHIRGRNNFTRTPDFSRVPFLEHLHISKCRSLVEVHPSLGKLETLTEVYLNRCENLEILPRKLETNSLELLVLCNCPKVAMLPEFGEGMKKLFYIDAIRTAITTLPESLGHLTSLRYLNLRFYPCDNVLRTCITREIAVFNVTSLTELCLVGLGLKDGSIPDDFSSLSSLISLDLSENEFVNLPTGCFSRLSQLVFLLLGDCCKLQSLPRLPPQLIRLDAYGCDSMEPLSDRQSWHLVASLNHECRGRTKYVISCEERDYRLGVPTFDYEPTCLLPLRDFCAILPASEIPSWFPNEEYLKFDRERWEYEIKVNIPPSLRDSEWSALVVCFSIPEEKHSGGAWCAVAGEDDDFIRRGWTRWYPLKGCLCIMVLELNKETCWKHLRGDNNTLHIKFAALFAKELPGCGWRVICKKEIQQWCNDNDFSELTQSQLASPHDHINIPSRVFENFKQMARFDDLRPFRILSRFPSLNVS